MPREETRHPFSEEEKGKVLDPNPERRRYLTDVFYKFLTQKISVAELMGLPKRKLARLAEVGYIKYKYGRYQEAMEIFKALAMIDATNAYYQTALGGIYQKMGQYVDSVIAYTRSLRLAPHDLCPYVNRGEIYLRHKNYPKAADDLRHAILLDPSGKNLWANRARSLVIALKRNMELKKRIQQAQQQSVNTPQNRSNPSSPSSGAKTQTRGSAPPSRRR